MVEHTTYVFQRSEHNRLLSSGLPGSGPDWSMLVPLVPLILVHQGGGVKRVCSRPIVDSPEGRFDSPTNNRSTSMVRYCHFRLFCCVSLWTHVVIGRSLSKLKDKLPVRQMRQLAELCKQRCQAVVRMDVLGRAARR